MLFFNPGFAIHASSAWPFPPALMFIIGPAWLAFILFILRYFSGWDALARVYLAQRRFAGNVQWFCSGSMNAVHFNNSLMLGADASGLYFGSLFPFSLIYPPLLIPWEDITATSAKVFWAMYVEFRFRQVPSVALRISENLARQLWVSNPVAPNEPTSPNLSFRKERDRTESP